MDAATCGRRTSMGFAALLEALQALTPDRFADLGGGPEC
jgi:hypothetical protein